MSNYTTDDLYDMSDVDLEAAFKTAKADIYAQDNPATEDSVEENLTESDDLDNSQESDLDGTENEVEATTKVDSEDSDADTDGDPELGSEQTIGDGAEAEADVQPAQKYSYKANGKEYTFTEEEIKQKFPQVFAQAMDYTKKMQAIKPYRKTIDAIEQAGLSHDDLSLAIDVLKGDKAAIAALLKRTGVDTLELDVDDKSYVPKSYGRDERTLDLKEVVDGIKDDQEFAVTSRIVDKDWDNGSWQEMSKDPSLIRALHIDVKSGVYNKVQPIAEKLKLYEGGRRSDLDYYKLAAQEYYKELAQEQKVTQVAQVRSQKVEQQVQQERKVAQVKTQEVSRKATEQAAAKRKAAAPTKTGASKPQGITDYLDDSEESYNDWYKSLQGK
jgi:YHS domain-containing protein